MEVSVAATSSCKTVELPFSTFHHARPAHGQQAEVKWTGGDLIEIELVDQRSPAQRRG